MPTLDWIGKKAVVNHHRDVPFHLLEEVPELSFGDKDSGNLLVQGDNLTALKALLPYYAGKVNVIFIDPPYNTGEEDWAYNDNVNSPIIKEWLGKTVGKEAEDLSRHDKWLCMMYPRLVILKELLSRDGIIAVAIDDNEIYYLGFLLDEIFGRKNRLACAPWLAEPSGGKSKSGLRTGHEYILIYHSGDDSSLTREESSTGNLDRKDKWGKYRKGRELLKWGNESLRSDREDMWFPIIAPDGTPSLPFRNDGKEGRWRWGAKGKMKNIIDDPELAHWEKRSYDDGIAINGNKDRWVPYEKIRAEKKSFGWNTWLDSYGFNSDATKELKEIFGEKLFDTPKPVSLVEWVISLHEDDNAIVLDSFAGSGTTAHATLKLNAQDDGKRNFIIVEMEKNVAEDVCTKRLTAAIAGYPSLFGKNKDKFIDGLGSGFRYYRLGKPLFDESGRVYKGITFSKLARHVFFTETGHPLEKEHCDSSLIGTYNNTAVYLLFNGILKDKKPDSGNVLTSKVLALLPEHDGPKVIYGTACRLSPVKLRDANIVFKQIPYEIKVD